MKLFSEIVAASIIVATVATMVSLVGGVQAVLPGLRTIIAALSL